MRLTVRHSERTPVPNPRDLPGRSYVPALTLTFVLRDEQLKRQGVERTLDGLRRMAAPYVRSLHDSKWGEPYEKLGARLPRGLVPVSIDEYLATDAVHRHAWGMWLRVADTDQGRAAVRQCVADPWCQATQTRTVKPCGCGEFEGVRYECVNHRMPT